MNEPTSKVAENGKTRKPRSRSATARFAMRICVGPRKFELKRTAAKMSRLPQIVSSTIADRMVATMIDAQPLKAPQDTVITAGGSGKEYDTDSD